MYIYNIRINIDELYIYIIISGRIGGPNPKSVHVPIATHMMARPGPSRSLIRPNGLTSGQNGSGRDHRGWRINCHPYLYI
jgi:hypothetical protein